MSHKMWPTPTMPPARRTSFFSIKIFVSSIVGSMMRAVPATASQSRAKICGKQSTRCLRASRCRQSRGLRLGATSSGRRETASQRVSKSANESRSQLARRPADSLKPQPLQIRAELLRKFWPLECELHRRLQHSELVAGVEPFAFEGVAEDLFFLEQRLDAVSQLDLASGSGLSGFEQFEDARREHVAADDGLRGWRFFELGFLHHAGAVIDARARLVLRAGQHAVGADAGAFNGHGGDHRAASFVEDFNHLLEAWRIGVDHIVGQDDREGLVAHKLFGAEHRVAQAEWLLLAHVADARHGRYFARQLEQLVFAFAFERRVELVADVEV